LIPECPCFFSDGAAPQALSAHGFETQVHIDLSQQQLEKIYRKWCDGLPRTCVALVLLCGQAVQFDGENFLVPQGTSGAIANKNAAKAQCISLSWMLGSLLRRLCSESLVILIADCSRSSPKLNGVAEGMASFEAVAGIGSRTDGQQAEGAQLYALCGAAPGSVACNKTVRGCSESLCGSVALTLQDPACASQHLRRGFFQGVVARAATPPWQVPPASPRLLQ